MFDAGALVFKLQTVGAQVFKQDQADAKAAVEKTGQASKESADKVTGLGKSTDETRKQSKKLSDDIKELEKQVREEGRASETAAQKLARLKQEQAEAAAAAKELSKVLLVAGAAAAAMVTLAVAKNAEFDQAMSQTRAATMATAAEQKTLGEAALKAGADTAYSASEAAAAEEELAKAGISVAAIVGGSLNGALALAAAGQLQVARSAEIMATTLTQFGLTADKSGHVADVLAAGAGKAQGEVEDLALALTYVGPLAKSAGWSLEETGGTLAYFASQGILGEKAGTSLRGVLAALQAPSTIAAKTMDQYGLSVYDANGKMLSASQMAAQLQHAFGGLTDQERNAAMGRIFGNESLTAATLLYNGGAQAISKWTDEVNDSGFAAEQAAMRQDNLAGDIEKLGGAFDTALIRTGSNANDVLRAMVQNVTMLVDMYGDAPEPVQALGLVLGVATAAILLFAGGAVGARAKFLELKATLDATNASMGKTALVGGAAGLALTGIITVVGLLMAKQAEARQRAEAYADTLEESSHRITKATAELVDENLSAKDSFLWWETPSAYDRAEELGVSLNAVKEAALGSTSELEKLKDMQEKANRAWEAARGQGAANERELLTRKEAVDELVGSVTDEYGSIEEAIRVSKQKQRADGTSAEAAQTVTEAYMEQAGSVDKLQKNLSDLIDTINKANGIAQDAVSANADWLAALEGTTGLIEQNGKSLEQNTAAGSANAAGLAEIASKAQAAAEAQLQQDQATMSADDATRKYVDTLGQQRQAFIDAAIKAGFSTDAVHALADEVFRMPSKKQIDIIAETAAAQRKIDQFVRLNNGKVVKVYVDAEGRQSYKIGGKTISAQADGGIVMPMAGGGSLTPMAPRAQAVPPNTWRVIGDRIRDREFYIPDDGSAQSLSVLGEAMRSFGVIPMAGGGIISSSAFAGSGAPGMDTLIAEIRALRAELGRPNVSITENFPVHTDPTADRLRESVVKEAGL